MSITTFLTSTLIPALKANNSGRLQWGDVADEIARILGEDPNANLGPFINFGTTGGSGDAYTIPIGQTPSGFAYNDGVLCVVRTDRINTAAVATTLNVNGLGAKKIRHTNGKNVEPTELFAGSTLFLLYSTTADGGAGAFLLLNEPSIQQTFTPTFTGSGSLIVTPSGATYRYHVTKNFVDVFILANLTLSGTTSNLIDITLPPIKTGPIMITPCSIDAGDSSGPFNAVALVIPSGGVGIIQVSTVTRSNFTLGAGGFVRIYGRYYIQ